MCGLSIQSAEMLVKFDAFMLHLMQVTTMSKLDSETPSVLAFGVIQHEE